MALSTLSARSRLHQARRHLAALRAIAIPEEVREAELAISTADRALMIRFFIEVVHGGDDEKIWRAKHPAEHARLVELSTVPQAGAMKMAAVG